MDPQAMRLYQLYEMLSGSGRLTCDSGTPSAPRPARWFLDGEELPAGTDYLTAFREAVAGG